jgi:hypothetical protein
MAAHVLWQLGAAALKPRSAGGKWLPPLVSYSQAMKLRAQLAEENQ